MLNKRNWWNVGTVAALALVALFAVAPASAQEQVGAIQGTVSDASGAVLPGATVEAVSAGGTRLSGTTNESGAYRFPRVPPGTYVVIAKLDGFNPAELQNVKVGLGDTATANVTLEVGAVSETISVVGEAGQIDVKSSATSAAITGEDIAMLPKGRDFTTIATMAPGVTQEGFAGGLSIDGASGSENRYVIDGVDTTDAFDGTSGQNLITEFVEEVQVKSAGYPAEFGGSVGGVINAVTKSGTNEFKGWVGVYYNDRDWDGAERATPYDTGTVSLPDVRGRRHHPHRARLRHRRPDRPGHGLVLWRLHLHRDRDQPHPPGSDDQDPDRQAGVLPPQHQGQRRLELPLQGVGQLGAAEARQHASRPRRLDARDRRTSTSTTEFPTFSYSGLRGLDPERQLLPQRSPRLLLHRHRRRPPTSPRTGSSSATGRSRSRGIRASVRRASRAFPQPLSTAPSSTFSSARPHRSTATSSSKPPVAMP